MKVMLVGKSHREGKSRKSGNLYNCTLAYVTYPSRDVDGLATDVIWLSAVDYPFDTLICGKTYDVDRDYRGFVINFKLS